MTFTIYPAIDLRGGQVVRLQQGDPTRQTTYGADPAAAAKRWLDAGATWLHVVNLDGAFGEADQANLTALTAILDAAKPYQAHVQFGGGMRTLHHASRAIELGVSRVIFGTAAVENPEVVEQSLAQFGPERVAVGIDALDGLVRVRGWVEGTALDAALLAKQFAARGLRWLIFTDVARDGVGTGINLSATRSLMDASGLSVIASGGVNSVTDIHAVRDTGLPGVIVGKALYDGKIDANQLF